MRILRPYQQDAVNSLAYDMTGRGILALPPGTGKTAIGSTIAGLHSTPKPCLIVAPNGPVLRHWQSELAEWGQAPSGLMIGPPKRRAAVRELVADEQVQIVITNYECMRGDIDALIALDFQTLIFDESHRLKNHKSLTFKSAIKLARRAQECYLLTGTPILNHAKDLWTSFAMLAPEKYKSFWRWAEHNFSIDVVRRQGRLVREIGNPTKAGLYRIAQELSERAVVGEMEKLLPNLPPVTETYLEVDLTSAERTAYKQMMTTLWMDVQGKIVTAETVSAKHIRLRQLASDWSSWGINAEPGTKAKAAASLIEDSEEQFLVLCAFRGTCEAIHALVPNSVIVHGGMTGIQREDSLEQFRQGAARVLVGTIATLGEGVDGLQCARNLIMVDRDWTPARNEQAIGRLRRSGQASAVNVIHLVANDTTDERVAQALREKTDVIEAIVKGAQ